YKPLGLEADRRQLSGSQFTGMHSTPSAIAASSPRGKLRLPDKPNRPEVVNVSLSIVARRLSGRSRHWQASVSSSRPAASVMSYSLAMRFQRAWPWSAKVRQGLLPVRWLFTSLRDGFLLIYGPRLFA